MKTSASRVPAHIVEVGLGDRSYPIHIGPGLLDHAPDFFLEYAKRPKCAIVTDENIAKLHLNRLTDALKAQDIECETIIVAPGESSKSFSTLEDLCDSLLAAGLERGDIIIAFGGGVIGDLAGFASAILRRGINFIQIPTSLLAQVDSSVGGKTGINSKLGKNLIGAFHQPLCVIVDISLLDTLPERELRAGYGEIVKYGALGDEALFSWLEKNWREFFEGNIEARIKVIETCCKAKAKIVAKDEHEAGVRALLNLGHTFGHALEAATGYSDRLLHGEGVAIGMCLAFRLSEEMGLAPAGSAARIEAHLREVGLPVTLGDIPGDLPDAEGMIAIMQQDKKAEGGVLTFILVKNIGSAFRSNEVEPDRLKSFLREQLST